MDGGSKMRTQSSSKAGRTGLNSGSSKTTVSVAQSNHKETVTAGMSFNTNQNPPVFFQGRMVTPLSLIQHRHITYISSADDKKAHDINAIDEENMHANIATPATTHKTRDSTMPGFARKFNLFSQTGGHHKGGHEVEEIDIVQLSETATEIVFALHSFISASDTRAIVHVEERNAKYLALIESHKNPDGFSSGSTQTVNNPQKHKEGMTEQKTNKEISCQASSYEILDETSSSAAGNEEDIIGLQHLDDVDPAGLSQEIRTLVNETLSVTIATPGCLLDTTVSTRLHYGSAADGKGIKKDSSGSGSNAVTAGAGAGAGGLGMNSNRRTSNLQGGASNTTQNTQTVKGGNISLKQASGKKAGSLHGGNSEQSQNNNNYYIEEIVVEEKSKAEILLEKESKNILASKALLKSLQIAERAVQQNAYHHKHLDYRDLPDGGVSPLLSMSLISHVEHNPNNKSALSLGKNSLYGGDDRKSKSAYSGFAASKSNMKSASSHKFSGYADSKMSESRRGDSKQGGSRYGASEMSSVKSDEGEEKTDKVEGKIHLLYSYKNDELVRGRPVTSMCWNCVNLDLLTVGYGTLETVLDTSKLGVAVDEELQGGLVLFWSLRNPDYPEKVLRTPHAVTCLDFSQQTPSLLAVGLISGDVLVYDMRRQREGDWGHPMESSMGIVGGHTDPVWQLSWVLKGSDRLETLVSVSTDGSILEWSLKKGLVVTTLMQLKKNGVGDGWITRKASGLCFDFLPSDPSSYMAGTEDGNVHHCSIAYNEQYLSTFEKTNGGGCHDGPVYRIAFSPHWSDIFLTSSADWTMSLFHSRQKSSLFNLHATGEDHGVHDICWCPGNSTLFAAVTEAKLQIWDLSVSSIDPVVNLDTNIVDETQGADKEAAGGSIRLDLLTGFGDSRPATASAIFTMEDSRAGEGRDRSKDSAAMRLLKNLAVPSPTKQLTCVKFGEKSPTVVVGDNRGVVTVYRLLNPISITHEGPLQQKEKLKSSILKQTDPDKAARLLDVLNRSQQQQGGLTTSSSVNELLKTQ